MKDPLLPITPAVRPPRSHLRRWAEVLAFLAIWIGLGLAFGLSTNLYLLLGVPLTIVFQLLVRRAPLRALWVREAPPFRLSATGWLTGLGLAVLPAWRCVASLRAHEGIGAGWYGCAVIGAFAAGYALQHFRRATAWALLGCVLVLSIAVIGGLQVLPNLAQHGRLQGDPILAVQWLLLYFPVVFVLEEVSFRGALDSHLYHPGERGKWLSALALSALWGLWHFPTLPPADRTFEVALLLMVFHTIVGVPLSLYWRKSGNLAVPGFGHALIDAVRNALQAGG
jgi:membrane protease YdiL (CAAX protease family)